MESSLILLPQVLKWVPNTLSYEFIQTVLQSYYDEKDSLPDIHDIMGHLRDMMLKILSYYDTNHQSTKYWTEFLDGIKDREEKNDRYYAITDKCFEPTFMDVKSLLNQLQMSHCAFDDRDRLHLLHYMEEVW